MTKIGRPMGSGLKDGDALDLIADALIRKRAKSVNGAIIMAARKLGQAPENHETYRRRLHRKWKRQGSERLASARDRFDEITVSARVRRQIGLSPDLVHQIGETQRRMVRMGESLRKSVERINAPVNQMRQSQNKIVEVGRAMADHINRIHAPLIDFHRPFAKEIDLSRRLREVHGIKPLPTFKLPVLADLSRYKLYDFSPQIISGLDDLQLGQLTENKHHND